MCITKRDLLDIFSRFHPSFSTAGKKPVRIIKTRFCLLFQECIFSAVKLRPYIFVFSLAWLLAVLHIQPLFITYGNEESQIMESSCAMMKQTCEKDSDCSNEKNSCRNEGCNPFVPCAIGICCYLVENFYTPSDLPLSKKQRIALIDDNTLLNATSEFWHPPEIGL